MGWNDLFFSSYKLPFEINNFYGRYQFFKMDSWQEFINHNNRRFPIRIARPLALSLIDQRGYQRLKNLNEHKEHPETLITLFSEFDLFSRDRTGINSVIEKVAGESGSYLINADEVVISSGLQGINNEIDNYHLTDQGNDFLAGLIADEIAVILSGEEKTDSGLHR